MRSRCSEPTYLVFYEYVVRALHEHGPNFAARLARDGGNSELPSNGQETRLNLGDRPCRIEYGVATYTTKPNV